MTLLISNRENCLCANELSVVWKGRFNAVILSPIFAIYPTGGRAHRQVNDISDNLISWGGYWLFFSPRYLLKSLLGNVN